MNLSHSTEPQGLNTWEAAYARFETPAEEIRKFRRRLLKLGASTWKRDVRIVELFCGRGNGLHALTQLGFSRLEGVDLSPALVAKYAGPATCHVSDCRHLVFEDKSKDIGIVQGGLHHLLTMPDDLEETLREVSRVLTDDGLFVVVEPWMTPFLAFVHRISRWPLPRRVSPRIDAFAIMAELEYPTYDRWLGSPQMVLDLLRKYFEPDRCLIGWGKLMFVGRKRAQPVDGTTRKA